MSGFFEINDEFIGFKSEMQKVKDDLKNDTDLNSAQLQSIFDAVEDRQKSNPVFKYVIPEYLYKPPFGHPRVINVPFLRSVAKNPYVYSVIKTISDQAVSTDWDIVPKEGVVMTPELEKDRRFIKEFFLNPNDDDESFDQIQRKLIYDLAVLDSGCLVKVYNRFGELLQLRAVDGGTIVKNPDMSGRLADRDDFIFDSPMAFRNGVTGLNYQDTVNSFKSQYEERAAYFQFSNTLQTSMPIPFGKQEIVYMMQNPDTSSVYSFASPVSAAVDIVLSLIFGAKYNLDFYMNGNTPEGIIQAAGLKPELTEALRDRLTQSMYTPEDSQGISRRIGYRLPVTNAADVKFIPLNFSSKEMEIISQQQWFTKVFWMCFGVTASEMGFTEDSNKAVDSNQTSTAARKAVTPILKTMQFYWNSKVIRELPNGDLFEFRYDHTDLDVEMKKRTLQKMEIDMGIKTWQMIAEEEGIDIEKLKADNQENDDREADKMQAQPEVKSQNLESLSERIINEIELQRKAIKNER